MQHNLVDLLTIEHILVGVEAKDARETIENLTTALVSTGDVVPEFAEDTFRREQVFPTGLPTQPIAVAIPHADPDHVNQSALCIGILKSPVYFAQMGTDGSILLDVRLVFLLAIKEREKQVEMIEQLVTLIQTGTLLEAMIRAKDPTEVLKIIQKAVV